MHLPLFKTQENLVNGPLDERVASSDSLVVCNGTTLGGQVSK